MSLARVSFPTTEPIPLADAKVHLRLEPDFCDDDAMITVLIQAAREHVEAITNQSFCEQAWRLTLDRFPCDDVITLGMPSVSAVTAFTYIDPSGTVTPFADYALDADAFPGRVVRAFGVRWPETRCQRNAVSITFTAGGVVESVPAGVIAAMKLLIGQWYANREATIDSRFALEVPFSVTALLGPYRRPAAEMA